MATQIEESPGIGPSEAQEKQDWELLVKWAREVERDLPLAEAFLVGLHLANLLGQLGMPERMIESAWKLTDRLRDKVLPLKPSNWIPH